MNTPQLVLNDEILNKIKGDATLFGIVAKAIDVSPYTLPNILNRNDPKLTQATSLRAIKDYLRLISDEELLTEREPSAATA